MTRTSFDTFRRQLAYKEAADIMDTITREKIELAEFLEVETQMDFDEALAVIEEQCTEILPGCRGIEKLVVFRNEIRDRLKGAIKEQQCCCSPAVRYGIDIPGLGGSVCKYCEEKMDDEEIPF